ncbi:hypothetical protein BP5796_08698 [Coleophoma crateriformis]|uniref:Proline dehydrogenase n=1 Tax=Coleophoma crateriformis TaxID=565419 RepID=A0A3D8R8U0_9HELO|nr:hypothetical protein BP5796_08698 [Coleophoma crateriformis]
MPLSKDLIFRISQGRLAVVHRHTIRWHSTVADKAIKPVQPLARWHQLSPRSKRAAYVLGGAGVTIAGMLLFKQDNNIQFEEARDIKALSTVPFRKLCTGWISFAFCSSPTWIDMSESLYSILSKVPIISSVTNVFIMHTFFDQFLGGEKTIDTIPKIEEMRRNHVGTLLGYNIEAELDGSSKDPQLIAMQVQCVLESIDAQGLLAMQYWPDSSATGGDNRFWVRLKVTGLLPHPSALYRGSQAILEARQKNGLDKDVPYPGLPHDGDWEAALNGKTVTDADRAQLLSLRATLEAIANRAREKNIRIVIDAEQTWYQPIIDILQDELMQRFNTHDGPSTCIASFQAYLRRYPQLLQYSIRRAEEKGYKLLFKQVRGAYMVTEAERWQREGCIGEGPVWSSKAETDASYNFGIEETLATVANQVQETGKSKLCAVFATHNAISIDLAIQLLEKYELAKHRSEDNMLVVSSEAAGSIAFAQLYGMKDDLTNRIVGYTTTKSGFPLVVKSMSYGDLKECLPFLARRAAENKSVLEGRGGAQAERARLGREIRRRLLPF